MYLSFVLFLYYCFDASCVGVSFFISEIHESKVIAETSDSKSVVAMFAIPPLACPPGRSLSTSNAGQSCLSSTKGASNAPSRQSALGPFVFNSDGRTGIQTANHAAGLVGLLQLAGAHPCNLVGTLGHSSWSIWFHDNNDAIFQSHGLLGMFNQVSLLVLLRHFALASNEARELYDQQHSNDQSGAANEYVPPWVQSFSCLFEAQQNVPSASAQAAEIRNERRSVVSGLTGRQALLGNHHSHGPAQLRSETLTNIGARWMRQISVRDVDFEVMGDDAMRNQMDNLLVEGFNDTTNEFPACCHCTNDSACRQNAHMDCGAERNDLAA